MSTIINPTHPLSSVDNDSGGLDIQGFQGEENRLNGSGGDDCIIGGHENDT